MSSYEPYDRDREYSRRYVREERRDDRDPRFYERDRYDSRQYGSSRDLVPRVAREDSELSVEEIQRGFPPPTGRDIRRSRSAEHYYEDEYDPRYDDRRSSRRGPASVYHEEEVHQKSKGISKNEKIIAAVAGAALLVGGKELYDRHEAKDSHRDVQRNALSSAALAGVGALAAYQGAEYYSKQQARKDQKATYILHRGRDGQVQEYYSDEDEDPRQKKGNKNFLESAIAATGLGAAVKSLTGSDKDKDRDDRSDTRSRGGDRDGDDKSGGNKVQKAAMASLLAGATEAFRVAKEPGGWQGEKTKRILTAAAGAAAVDSAQSSEHGKLGMAQSVIGGLVGNRLVNGSKNEIEEDKKTGRSRSRSRARSQSGGMSGTSGLAALATAGLGAVGAKKAYDGYRESRSRSRGRAMSDGSRSPSPRKRSRSRSVVDRARNSLAKLGIGAGAGGAGALAVDDARRRDQDDFDDRGSRRGSRRYSDDYDDDYRSSRYDRERDRDYYLDDRDYRGSGRRDRSRRSARSDYTSESDLGDSDDDQKKQKRLRGKQILTTGLATVATIHAAHGVYQSMEKRNARHRAVKEGRLSPAEAKKLKTKAMMQDAASVGIAAMGIKGAVGEMKQAKDLNHECKDFQNERQRRHEKREARRRRAMEANREHKRAESWDTARDRYDGYDSDSEDEYYGRRYGPRYYDDNPYGNARQPAAIRGRA